MVTPQSLSQIIQLDISFRKNLDDGLSVMMIYAVVMYCHVCRPRWTSLDNELLLSRPVQARLLFSMRKPVVDLEEGLERAGRCTTKQEGSGKSSGGCCGLIRGLGRVSWQ